MGVFCRCIRMFLCFCSRLFARGQLICPRFCFNVHNLSGASRHKHGSQNTAYSSWFLTLHILAKKTSDFGSVRVLPTSLSAVDSEGTFNPTRVRATSYFRTPENANMANVWNARRERAVGASYRVPDRLITISWAKPGLVCSCSEYAILMQVHILVVSIYTSGRLDGFT